MISDIYLTFSLSCPPLVWHWSRDITNNMEVPADPWSCPLLPGSGPISVQPQRPALWALVWPLVRQNADHQEDHPVCQLLWDYRWVTWITNRSIQCKTVKISIAFVTEIFIEIFIESILWFLIYPLFKIEKNSLILFCFTLIRFPFSVGNFMYFMGYSKWLLLASRLVAGESKWTTDAAPSLPPPVAR